MPRVDIGRRSCSDHPEHLWVRGQASLRSLLRLPLPLLASVRGVGKPLEHLVGPSPRTLPLQAGRQVAHTILDLRVEVRNARLRRDLHPTLVFRQTTGLDRSGKRFESASVELVAPERLSLLNKRAYPLVGGV
jgi:hypothetical protein